jgi:triphosphoribosyl-dephospho-CoA synthase
VTLKAAMAEAAGRDRIARQYATDFEDVFGLGEGALTSALLRWADRRWATLAVFLAFLSAFPDSHIVRKHGDAAAEATRRTAEFFRARLDACAVPDTLMPDLMTWDTDLKRVGINPGTSADLTVATLFVHRLRNSLPSTQRSG